MNSISSNFVRHLICVTAALTLIVVSGCNTSSSKQVSAGLTSVGAKKVNLTGATIELQEMMKNPSGPFHASFTETWSDNKTSSIEADVTASEIDYTARETHAGQTSSNTKHLQRDQISELELDMQIMAPVPWHGELLLAEGTTQAQGAEKANGYDTIKYSLDTSRVTTGKAPILAAMGVKDYRVSGLVWLTANDGCLVKWNIDAEKDNRDGTAERTHYEGNVTKK
jgi:hypothetical protein